MAYDFHYQPTGSGAISGQQVLEQTEDAINELGDYVNDNVGGAMDVAQQALETAQNAKQDAQTALNTANNAEGVAIQAQNDVSNLSGTVTNIGNRVTTAEGNIGNLQGRMTTAEGNITNLQGRMTTAEGNIGNLQTAVSTAQATANSAQQTATTARQQSYVFRYSSTALVASSTNSNTLLDNTDNLKVGDKVIDSNGVLFSITAIDTQNSTFTIGTALIDLAQDSDVVHKSGNEAISGAKTFGSDLTVYNSDTTAYASYLNLKNQRNVRGSTTDTGTQGLQFQDKNSKILTMLESRVISNGNTGFNIICYNTDGNNQTVSDGVTVIKTPTDTNFAPTTDNAVTCGRALAKWSDVQTYKVNGVEPSSLSLPSGNANNVIDISSYIIDLSGNVNNYTAPANGWITITCLGCTGIKFSITDLWANGSYRENPNQISTMIPICKNQKVGIYIYGSSPTIQAARFIPCQGNV